MALTREKFYVVVPKASTNLCTNPSFELATTGWSGGYGGSTIARVAGYGRRGAYALRVTPATGQTSGALYTFAATAGTTYTASIDLDGTSGVTYRISWTDTSYNIQAQPNYVSGGGYERLAVTFTAASSTNYYLIIARITPNTNVDPFYIDGCLIEAASEASTYFDGDSWGLTLQRDYGWNGTRQASTSYRLSRTRAGGTLLYIETYAKILGHYGLGRAPEQHFTSEINADGELYQATKVMPRDFVINMVFSGSTADVATQRKALLAALQLDKTPIRQPIVLRYQGTDESGNWMTEPVNIKCLYKGGLERSASTYGVEKCAVQFQMTSPYMDVDGETGTELGYASSVTNFANIGYRDTDGVWKAMGTGVSGGPVECMVKMADGSIVIGGEFTSAGGVANTAHIAKWTGTAWQALGTGANSNVFALAIGPDGYLYAGGQFTSMGGVANTARIARWTGSAWQALSTGIASGFVWDLTFGFDGKLYIGGSFTNHIDANGDYITIWDGSAYTSLGTGMNNEVKALITGLDGAIYAGGAFTLANGVSASKVAKWDGSTWTALGAGANNNVYELAIGLDGAIYIGGIFTSAGGVSGTAYVAKWNGSAWQALSTGTSGTVYTISVNSDGSVNIGGTFGSAGGVIMPDRMAIWRGGGWQPMDVNVSATSATIYSILPLEDGRVYVGGSWVGSTATSATVTVPNNTGTKAYPEIEIYGPGTIWQIKNYTNDAALYFENLTLLTGESVFIDCNPFRFRILSSWRGDLQNYILPGSTNLVLEPGNNNVSAYLMNTGAGSSLNMSWKPTLSTIDEALR